jgi:hypothetical protein
MMSTPTMRSTVGVPPLLPDRTQAIALMSSEKSPYRLVPYAFIAVFERRSDLLLE